MSLGDNESTTLTGPSATKDDGLAKAASKGTVHTALGQGVRVGLQLVSVVVLSRLLDPDDFGLVAMALAVIGVSEVLRDFGLSQAAVQRSTLSRAEQSNLFWLNTAMGLLMTVICAIAAWPIASLYGHDELVWITQGLALTFLLNGISTQFRVVLMRSLAFGKLAAIEAGAQAAGLSVAVVAAYNGAGVLALVLQTVSAAVIAFLLLVLSTRWMPGRWVRGVQMRGFLDYGGFLVLSQLLGYASKNVDSLILGVTGTPAQVGLYNRAYQLAVVPLNQINAPATRVALPVLSRARRDDLARYRRFFLAAQVLLLHATVAFLVCAAAIAEPLIEIVLGAEWLAAVPIFQLLLVAGVFQTAGYVAYWAFLSEGRMRSQLRYALVTRPIAIALIAVGSHWGVVGVAAGFALGAAVSWPVALWWVRSYLPRGTSRALLLNGMRVVLVNGVAGGVTWATVEAATAKWELATLLSLVVGVAIFIGAWAIVMAAVPAARRDVAVGRGFLLKALGRDPVG